MHIPGWGVALGMTATVGAGPALPGDAELRDALELDAVVVESLDVPSDLPADFTVDVTIDGEVVASSGWPFAALVQVAPGDHELVARPKNARLGVRSEPVRISVR